MADEKQAEARKYMPNKVRRRKAKEALKEQPKTEAVARARYVKSAPQKVRLVADMVRGKGAKDAVAILQFTPKRAAQVVEKVVQAAIANAENNHNLNVDNLIVHRIYVDGGPVMRRFRAGSMGRATPIRKKTSHITVVVKEREEVKAHGTKGQSNRT